MHRVVRFDLADTQKVMHDFIPEDKNAHLETISAVDNDKFAIVYKRNVSLLSTFSHVPPSNYFAGRRRTAHLLVRWATSGAFSSRLCWHDRCVRSKA
jgi:hypothetical protein